MIKDVVEVGDSSCAVEGVKKEIKTREKGMFYTIGFLLSSLTNTETCFLLCDGYSKGHNPKPGGVSG